VDVKKSEEKYDVYAVIGHAVSCLIASGLPVEAESILMLLRQAEARSVDGMKKVYAQASQVVASRTV